MKLAIHNALFKRRAKKGILKEEFLRNIRRREPSEQAPARRVAQRMLRSVARQAQPDKPLIRQGDLSPDMQHVLPAVNAAHPVLHPVGRVPVIEQVHDVIMLVTGAKLRIIRRAQPLHEDARLPLKAGDKRMRRQNWKILRAHQVQIRHPRVAKRHAAKIKQGLQMGDAAPVDLAAADRAHAGHRIQLSNLPGCDGAARIHMNKAQRMGAQRAHHARQSVIILIGGDDHGLHGIFLRIVHPRRPAPLFSQIKRAAETSGPWMMAVQSPSSRSSRPL